MSRKMTLLLTIALSITLLGCSSKASIEVVNDVSSGSDFSVGIDAGNGFPQTVEKGVPRTFEIEWSGNEPLQTRIWGHFLPFHTGLREEDITIEDGGNYVWRINEQGFAEYFHSK